jgi:mycoketide-CoA synthase
VPMRLHLPALRRLAEAGLLPPLLRGLVRAPARKVLEAGARSADSLRESLAGLAAQEVEAALTELVWGQAAAVLGHASPEAVEPGRAFKELGFDSLTAVEFRNRLTAASGLRLPVTLVFAYPTATALAGYLRDRLAPDAGPAADPAQALLAEVDRLEAALTGTAAPDDATREVVTARLRSLLAGWQDANRPAAADGTAAEDVSSKLEAASKDEVLDFITNELGIS